MQRRPRKMTREKQKGRKKKEKRKRTKEKEREREDARRDAGIRDGHGRVSPRVKGLKGKVVLCPRESPGRAQEEPRERERMVVWRRRRVGEGDRKRRKKRSGERGRERERESSRGKGSESTKEACVTGASEISCCRSSFVFPSARLRRARSRVRGSCRQPR